MEEEEGGTMTNIHDDEHDDDHQYNDNSENEYDNGDDNDKSLAEGDGTINNDETDDTNDKTNGDAGGHSNGIPPLIIPDIKTDDGNAPAAVVPATPSYLIPSLRGRLISEGTSSVCRGVWAMSDAGHNIPGQTSEFEFKLSKPAPDTKPYPLSGIYQGWFHLKQAPPKQGHVKIEDKEINIKFTESGDGTYAIQGMGHNKFGSFTLKGTLSADGMMQMFREYTPVIDKRRSTSITPKAKTPRATPGVNSDAATVPFPTVTQQREGAGRVRKQSSLMKENIESMTPRTSSTPKANPSKQTKPAVPVVGAPTIAAPAKYDSSRVQRTSAPMLKCMDILKEMQKYPLGVYFLEPVDYVKLQIPDYPTIITNPMDFRTIKGKLDASIYNTPEQFADDMRLVFRNATTYNADREHVVHKAARDCQSRFEDRFRALTKQLTQNTQAFVDDASFKAKVKGPKGPKGTGKPQGRPSFGSARQTSYLAPALDTQTQLVIDMKKKMEEMEKQMHEMQSQLKKNEIKTVVEEKRQAAQNPLSAEDKRILLSKIERLPEEKMQDIVDIVRDAIPVDGSNTSDQVEIELDKLDTLTLRKLQKYVDGENRKRPAGGAVGRPVGSVAKKPRANAPKQKGKPPAKTTSYSQPPPSIPNYNNIPPPLIPASFEDDALLFNPDSFEDMREGADGERSDDDNDGGDQDSNHNAWLKASPSTNNQTLNANSNNNGFQWNAAAAEVDAKRNREIVRKAEEEKLIEARRLEEANRSAMLAREHQILEEQRKRKIIEDEQNNSLSLSQKRDEERLKRELMKQATLDQEDQILDI